MPVAAVIEKTIIDYSNEKQHSTDLPAELQIYKNDIDLNR